MFNNKSKCFITELFSNTFQLQTNSYEKETQIPLSKQNLFKQKSLILIEDEEAKYTEDFFLNKVNLI